MQFAMMRSKIAQAVWSEQQINVLRQHLAQAMAVRGSVDEDALETVVALVREYVERLPDAMEVLLAHSRSAEAAAEVQTLLDAVERCFVTPPGGIPDDAGLLGLTDNAYFAYELLMAFRVGTMDPDTRQVHESVSRMIGQRLADGLENTVHQVLTWPDVRDALDRLSTRRSPVAAAKKPKDAPAKAARPARPTAEVPQADRKAAKPSPQVQTMYWSTQFRPASGRETTEHLTFYTNGLVFRGWIEEGPGDLDFREWNEFVGTYKISGDRISIAWNSPSRTQVFVREGDRLDEETSFAGKEWYLQLPSVDGLRLQGTYVRKIGIAGVPEPWISFASDGTFHEEGVLDAVLTMAQLLGRRLPQSGSGTYTINCYSIELQYGGGSTERVALYIRDADLKTPRQIFLNTFNLDRQAGQDDARKERKRLDSIREARP